MNMKNLYSANITFVYILYVHVQCFTSVNATIQQDILALNGTECATPEQKAQLTSLDQRLEELEKRK